VANNGDASCSGATVGILQQEPQLDETRRCARSRDGVRSSQTQPLQRVAELMATDYSDELMEEMVSSRRNWTPATRGTSTPSSSRRWTHFAAAARRARHPPVGGERDAWRCASCCCPSPSCCCSTSHHHLDGRERPVARTAPREYKGRSGSQRPSWPVDLAGRPHPQAMFTPDSASCSCNPCESRRLRRGSAAQAPGPGTCQDRRTACTRRGAVRPQELSASRWLWARRAAAVGLGQQHLAQRTRRARPPTVGDGLVGRRAAKCVIACSSWESMSHASPLSSPGADPSPPSFRSSRWHQLGDLVVAVDLALIATPSSTFSRTVLVSSSCAPAAGCRRPRRCIRRRYWPRPVRP